MRPSDRLAGARRLHRARRLLTLSAEEIARRQVRWTNRVLEAAMRTVAYRRLYAPREDVRIERMEDLAELPMVDRAFLARHPIPERVAGDITGFTVEVSTGTSGTALASPRSAEEHEMERVLMERCRMVHGLPSDALALHLLLGRDRNAPYEVTGPRLATIGAYRRVEEQLEAIHHFGPEILFGPSSVVQEVGQRLGRRPMRAVFTFGEVMDHTVRDGIHRSFATEPIDIYGASEIGLISFQCPAREGFHINADAAVVEVVDDDGDPVPPGELGHLVITALRRTTTPAIRYRVGDLGSLLPGPCPCGLPLSRMGPVHGRDNDRVATVDGRWVSPFRVMLGVDTKLLADPIRRYRVVQRDVADFLVEAVWHDREPPWFHRRISELYARAVGGPVTVEVRTVEDITPPPGRKFRVVESLVPPPASTTR
jgi:phenylacetate-CoA ligase